MHHALVFVSFLEHSLAVLFMQTFRSASLNRITPLHTASSHCAPLPTTSHQHHQVGGKEERADPAVRRPEPDALTVAGGPLSRLSVFTHNAPMAFSAPLADLYDARWAEVARGRAAGTGGRGAARHLRGGGGGGEEEGGGEAQHMRFEHRSDRVRKLPPSMDMKHVGDRELEGTGLVEDGGVIAGSAIAVVGVVAAMLAAAAKVVNSH